MTRLRDGEPCKHPGCLKHVTHPCEGCGRIGGQYHPVGPVLAEAQSIIDASNPTTEGGANALYEQIPVVINRLLEIDAEELNDEG
jgi:hypothetical protein